MRRAEYCTVRYHSHEWMLLVETGWITMFVDNHRMARMIRESGR